MTPDELIRSRMHRAAEQLTVDPGDVSDVARRASRSWSQRALPVVMVTALVVVGLGAPLLGLLALSQSAGSTSQQHHPPIGTGSSGGDGAASAIQVEGQAEIYAGTVSELLAKWTQDSGHSFGAIYVYDRPTGQSLGSRAAPFPYLVRKRILDELAGDGLKSVRFIDDRTSVIASGPHSGVVRDHGVVVTLGPTSTVSTSAHVAASAYFGPAGGISLTFVARSIGGGWKVVGTVGGVGVG